MEIYGATSRKWGKDSEHIQFVHQFAKPTSAARLASSRMRAGYSGHEPSLAEAAKGVGRTVGVLSIVAQWRDDRDVRSLKQRRLSPEKRSLNRGALH